MNTNYNIILYANLNLIDILLDLDQFHSYDLRLIHSKIGFTFIQKNKIEFLRFSN